MSIPSTLYVVTDTETTVKKQLSFDIAWKTIDKHGKEYDRGSYLISEVFRDDIPFFKEKLGEYFDDVYSHLIKPASFKEIRDHYNNSIISFKNAGHKVILCAYNAAFDFRVIPNTYANYFGDSFKFLTTKVELLDIWKLWGDSVPLCYSAGPSASGKYRLTSAEAAYKFEFCKNHFEERHIAWHDCEIEAEILVKVLKRKKKQNRVSNPKDFRGAVWKDINTRLGIDGTVALT